MAPPRAPGSSAPMSTEVSSTARGEPVSDELLDLVAAAPKCPIPRAGMAPAPSSTRRMLPVIAPVLSLSPEWLSARLTPCSMLVQVLDGGERAHRAPLVVAARPQCRRD